MAPPVLVVLLRVSAELHMAVEAALKPCCRPYESSWATSAGRALCAWALQQLHYTVALHGSWAAPGLACEVKNLLQKLQTRWYAGGLWLQTATPVQLAAGVVAGAALQGALAAPFLAAAPMSYASKAFELSRVFLHRWTVNLKFLPEDIFQRCLCGALVAAVQLFCLCIFWPLVAWHIPACEPPTSLLCERRGLQNRRGEYVLGQDSTEPHTWYEHGDRVRPTSCAAWSHMSLHFLMPNACFRWWDDQARLSSAIELCVCVCSPGLAACLLAAHLLLLAVFAQYRWTGGQGLAGVLRSFWARRHLAGQQRPGVILHGAVGSGGNGSGTASAQADSNSNSQQLAGRGLAAGGSGGGSNTVTGAAADKLAGYESQQAAGGSMTTAEIVWIVWTGNFIGIVCARTLHYQFYSWYCHSLPFLLWSTSLRTWQRLSIWLAIEVIWNVYPPTAASSLLLLTCHCVLLAALWRRPTHL